MFDWLQGNRADRRKAGEIYGAVVAQAREPALYEAFGVPDTYVGRYEMVALHLALVLERLAAADIADEDLRRALLERFVTDMDDSMREIGFGDTSVPRNVKKAAAGLYERGIVYHAALAEPDGPARDAAVMAALERYVFATPKRPVALDGSERPPDPAGLAAYVRTVHRGLGSLPSDAVLSGRLGFTGSDGADRRCRSDSI